MGGEGGCREVEEEGRSADDDIRFANINLIHSACQEAALYTTDTEHT